MTLKENKRERKVVADHSARFFLFVGHGFLELFQCAIQSAQVRALGEKIYAQPQRAKWQGIKVPVCKRTAMKPCSNADLMPVQKCGNSFWRHAFKGGRNHRN